MPEYRNIEISKYRNIEISENCQIKKLVRYEI